MRASGHFQGYRKVLAKMCLLVISVVLEVAILFLYLTYLRKRAIPKG